MEIIPAIDIMAGKCVRLTRGDYRKKKIYSNDPLKIALTFQKAGIKKLHLVDLDGAKAGTVKNWNVIEKLAKKTNLTLQVGGGFRIERDITRLLRLGPHEVTLGTIALKNPHIFKKLFQKFGKEKIIVDIAVKNGWVALDGWQKRTKENFFSFLEKLSNLGVKSVICTDISRDGTLQGPNFSLYRTLMKKIPTLRIIASGGVANIDNIKKLATIGVSGVIIGKAIYEKRIVLKDLKPFL